jgi:hypothetical protein
MIGVTSASLSLVPTSFAHFQEEISMQSMTADATLGFCTEDNSQELACV